MRPNALLSTVLAASALTATGGLSAAHAVETCYGLAPTLTAPAGTDTLRGTEGDDVIIAADVRVVMALGGNDTVCLTGASYVLAGAGNDRVQSQAAASKHKVVLGSGSDLFDGSTGRDWVYAENFDGEDPYGGEGPENTDVVRTLSGDDRVWSGAAAQTNHDQVDLGDGDDSVMIDPGQGGDAVLLGGGGDDEVKAKLGSRPGTSFTFDLTAGTADMGGARFAAVEGFDDAFIDAYESDVTVRGTDGPNDVFITGRATVHALAGSDRIRLHGDLLGVDSGAGRDYVEVMGYGDYERKTVVYDLRRNRFTRGGVSAPFHTETLYVWGTGGSPVLVIGSPRRDVVTMGECGSTVRGGGGADRLSSRAEMCERVPTTLAGGGGDDLLVGGQERDVLVGGGGRDRALGGSGRDRCRAEVERDCER